MKKIYTSPLFKIINSSLINLPTPMNISIFWNFGSLLGLCLITQMVSGFMLTMHYTANTNYAFFSIIHIMQDMNYGWLIRLTHMNGASMFFICIYLHIGRGIYYGSYKMELVWNVGIILLFILMGTAFMGYVLPWGQMSFWGATVITNLLSALPFIGQILVEWLWGGFSVDNATLTRFYSFHFILPFILTIFVILHLFFLHQTGSSNPLGLKSSLYMIKFHNYFTIKDMLGFIYMFYILMLIILECPYVLGDSENFLMANSLITPIHIQPEWYFLFAYSILRSIPNKLGGVIALVSSILILYIKPLLSMMVNFKSMSFYLFNQFNFWLFFNNLCILTWLGSQPVETPFTEMSQILTFLYFSYFIMNPMIKLIWDKQFKNKINK